MIPTQRLIRSLFYCTCLAALIWYGHTFFPNITLQMCLADPDLYDGTTIEVGNEATVKHLFNNGFSILQLGKEVRVVDSTTDVAPGEYVVLKAIFHKPDGLEALKVRVAKKRRAKIWLSIFPALFITVYFFQHFRFNAHSFYFEERC